MILSLSKDYFKWDMADDDAGTDGVTRWPLLLKTPELCLLFH